ncbi:MAG: sporulation transcriptional regulator SpoIIID [Clostridiales bacterium]|jgi:putative DeoR family transcriptional regulator (stage III sporulation protein D)|nr:sporulation transcriptional regulator SpoIIID [Clostridiales bacterium]
MRATITRRALDLAAYVLSNHATVRGAATAFGVSKSTVHKDVTERLTAIDPPLAARVAKILAINLAERHLRGGASTKEKYKKPAIGSL